MRTQQPSWLDAFKPEQTDWDALEATFPHVTAMRACIQDPVHHAEGDVWTHTRMVCDEIETGTKMTSIRLAGLYHDVCKPQTRTLEMKNGREAVTHPRHARLGAQVAWRELWEAEVDHETRLVVYWLCMWHQRVFHMWSQDDMIRKAVEFAAVGNWKNLTNFARCDTLGRICQDQQNSLYDIALLEEWLYEHNLFQLDDQIDPVSRRFYLEKSGRSRHYVAQHPVGSRVIVMSGLPGSGKDTYISKELHGWPVISLDQIREDMDVDPTDNQGQVIQAAHEQARVYLRAKTPFVWNGTNLTKMVRGKIIQLARDYDAYVEIHALDRTMTDVLRQNADRDRQVPNQVIKALAQKWEPPSVLEAHDVKWV